MSSPALTPSPRPAHRPGLYAAICFAAGVYLSELLTPCVAQSLGMALASYAAVVWGYCRRWPPAVQGVLTAALLVTLGAAAHTCRRQADRPVGLLEAAASGQSVRLSGRVAAEPVRTGDAVRVVLSVSEVTYGDTCRGARGDVMVRFAAACPGVQYGDRLSLDVTLRRPDAQRNPGGFDYRRFLARRGIWATATVRRANQVAHLQAGTGAGLWTTVVHPARRAVRRAVDRNLSGGPAGLLKGVLLGEKRAVPDRVREAFQVAGVNHVLAVSGLHVGLVAGCVLFGLRMLSLSRWVSCLATATALVAYACLTGLPPSVLRACVTGCLALMACLGSRDPDGLNTLGLAGLGLLAVEPGMLWDVGFQLSFAATASILLFRAPISKWLGRRGPGPWRRWVAPALAVSLAAQLGTSPLVALHFGRLSPVSLGANLVVVPLMGAAVGLGILTVLAAFALPVAATWLNGTNWVVLQAAIRSAEVFASLPFATVDVPAPGPAFGLVYACVLPLLLPGVRSGRWGRILVLLCLAFCDVWVWWGLVGRRPCVEVWVLDVGNGDAVFVRFPTGRTMLVDGGNRAGRQDAGAQVVLPFLRARGVRKIDVVVGSHPHSDHIGGLATVLEKVAVGHYLDPGVPDSSRAAVRIRDTVRRLGIPYTVVAAGDSLAGLGAGAIVLHPPRDLRASGPLNAHEVNSRSVVIRVDFEGRAALLTGDVEQDTDGDLIRWGTRVRADFLKAAHHGSRTSSSAAFLRAVHPRAVAISCGRGNLYGHPSPEVIDRLAGLGLRVLRTDRQGAVCARLETRELVVSAWLDP